MQTALRLKPFLKWAGGKTKLIPQYLPYIPTTFGNYHEPFLGGGAMFFYLQDAERIRQRVFLSDTNEDLIQAYRCLRDNPEAVCQHLESYRENHCRVHYYEIRDRVRNLSSVERAARLIYLNKTCFNGLYRVNLRGDFNVPMGSYKNPRIFDAAHLADVSLCLQYASLEVRDFTTVKDRAVPGDFVYFDPPYVPISTTSNFTNYSRVPFGIPEHEQLASLFHALVSAGVRVLVSNSDCALVRDLYQGCTIVPVWADRAINSKGDRRGKVAEVLIVG